MKHTRRKPKRITEAMLNRAHLYMSMWCDQERWTDINSCLEHHFDTAYAAHLLVSAGAINSQNIKRYGAEHHKETAYQTELVIEELAKRFRSLSAGQQLKYISNLFKNDLVVSCDDCNEVSFIPDKNEELYPELKQKCWCCESANIEVKRGIDDETTLDAPTPCKRSGV